MLGAAALAARGQSGAEIPKRPLGRTGLEVSALGIGGYHLGSANSDAEATQIVNEALDAGVNFFDNAWEYHQGLSEERLGRALKGKRDRAVVMTKVCTHGRDKRVAMRQLEESLTRLQTDHLDVWQIHEVIYETDPDLIFAPNGAAEALLEAKQQGKVRFVGFTGHKDPSIHLKMFSHNFPFDTVQMPLNAFDANYHSFEQQVLPELNRRGIAALGMKPICGHGEPVQKGVLTGEEALRYAMSLPVTTTMAEGLSDAEPPPTPRSPIESQLGLESSPTQRAGGSASFPSILRRNPGPALGASCGRRLQLLGVIRTK